MNAVRAHPLQNYLTRHAQVALNSLGRLFREPVGALMTVAVIAIALALPAALYLVTGNLQKLSTQWDGDATISVFMKQTTAATDTAALADRLKTWPEIADVKVITPDEALAEFKDLSGFGDALALLDENPLPAVLALRPATDLSQGDAADQLLQRLRAEPGVDLVQLDLQWVKRFKAMVRLAQKAIGLIASLLGLAVLLIVGNTIRLEIQNRRAEIEITQLIGATPGFIRRPFLYSGVWYGLAGALLAWLLVQLAIWSLGGPVSELAGLYDSAYRLAGFSVQEFLLLLVAGTLLGLAGAFVAVGRHLGSLDPL